jgi:hypothetical protein
VAQFWLSPAGARAGWANPGRAPALSSPGPRPGLPPQLGRAPDSAAAGPDSVCRPGLSRAPALSSPGTPRLGRRFSVWAGRTQVPAAAGPLPQNRGDPGGLVSRQLGRAEVANPARPGFPWTVQGRSALALAVQAADIPVEPAGVPAAVCIAKIS